MSHFIITYRIKHDESYQGRYDSFIKRLTNFSPERVWKETSSFYAFEACASAKDICSELCGGSGFDCMKDSVVVIDITKRTMSSSGAIRDIGLLEQCVGFGSQ